MTVPPAILMTVPLAVPLTAPMTATLDRPLTAVLSQYPYRTTRAPDSTSAPCSPGAAATCKPLRFGFQKFVLLHGAAVLVADVHAEDFFDADGSPRVRSRTRRSCRCSVAALQHKRAALAMRSVAPPRRSEPCVRSAHAPLLGPLHAAPHYTLLRSRAQRCAQSA